VQRAHTAIGAPAIQKDRSGRWWQTKLPKMYGRSNPKGATTIAPSQTKEPRNRTRTRMAASYLTPRTASGARRISAK
jgi:hypothetical protein